MPDNRDARVVVNNVQQWTNKHQNFTQDIELSYDVWNPPPPVTDGWSDMRLTVAKLQLLIRQASQDNVRLRAYGGTWSLSEAAVTDGRLINTKPLNWWFPLRPNYVAAEYQGDRNGLIFAQCGISVFELNDHLAKRKYALKTSGASNGQTIVGAFSTGTHGSALEVGSMQDYVVGLHLIVSPDRHIWLERATRPVVSDDLITKLGAELTRDDELFNAALVSFGSFGIIHAVLLETEALYLLEATRQRIPLDNQLRRAMDTLDVSGLPLPHPNERPFHFEVLVNPYDLANGANVTTMYKRPYRDNYTPPSQSGSGYGVGDDALAFIGTLGDVVPALVPTVVNTMVGTIAPLYSKIDGIHGEIFSSTDSQGKALSTEIGVAIQHASAALDRLLAAQEAAGPFAGLFAFRFLKQSAALLAFTKFPHTCTIELPGTFSSHTERFYQRVWLELDQAGIPYTLHWGQANNFTPNRVRTMYGAAVNQWMQNRRNLLSDQMRQVFSSPFLERCGLAF